MYWFVAIMFVLFVSFVIYKTWRTTRENMLRCLEEERQSQIDKLDQYTSKAAYVHRCWCKMGSLEGCDNYLIKIQVPFSELVKTSYCEVYILDDQGEVKKFVGAAKCEGRYYPDIIISIINAVSWFGSQQCYQTVGHKVAIEDFEDKISLCCEDWLLDPQVAFKVEKQLCWGDGSQSDHFRTWLRHRDGKSNITITYFRGKVAEEAAIAFVSSVLDEAGFHYEVDSNRFVVEELPHDVIKVLERAAKGTKAQLQYYSSD